MQLNLKIIIISFLFIFMVFNGCVFLKGCEGFRKTTASLTYQVSLITLVVTKSCESIDEYFDGGVLDPNRVTGPDSDGWYAFNFWEIVNDTTVAYVKWKSNDEFITPGQAMDNWGSVDEMVIRYAGESGSASTDLEMVFSNPGKDAERSGNGIMSYTNGKDSCNGIFTDMVYALTGKPKGYPNGGMVVLEWTTGNLLFSDFTGDMVYYPESGITCELSTDSITEYGQLEFEPVLPFNPELPIYSIVFIDSKGLKTSIDLE